MITDGLIAGAQRALDASGRDVASSCACPASFELPVAAKAALEAGADAVVALGVIIRGGTPHFEFVSSAATDGLTRVALDTGKPVGFGVLTLDDEQQGLDRAGPARARRRTRAPRRRMPRSAPRSCCASCALTGLSRRHRPSIEARLAWRPIGVPAQ